MPGIIAACEIPIKNRIANRLPKLLTNALHMVRKPQIVHIKGSTMRGPYFRTSTLTGLQDEEIC